MSRSEELRVRKRPRIAVSASSWGGKEYTMSSCNRQGRKEWRRGCTSLPYPLLEEGQNQLTTSQKITSHAQTDKATQLCCHHCCHMVRPSKFLMEKAVVQSKSTCSWKLKLNTIKCGHQTDGWLWCAKLHTCWDFSRVQFCADYKSPSMRL